MTSHSQAAKDKQGVKAARAERYTIGSRLGVGEFPVPEVGSRQWPRGGGPWEWREVTHNDNKGA